MIDESGDHGYSVSEEREDYDAWVQYQYDAWSAPAAPSQQEQQQ